MQGYIINFNKNRGYGFIKTNEYEENIFVHISEVVNGNRLEKGQKVEFKVKKTNKGLAATEVKAGSKQHSAYLIFGVISFIIFLLSIYFSQKTDMLLAYLIAINLTTFLLYGYDKFISSRERLRVPELNLQILALLGGSPAALFAQKLFRHKTIKSSFQLIYWLIVFLQFGLLIFFIK